jgi:hypothetical protein
MAKPLHERKAERAEEKAKQVDKKKIVSEFEADIAECRRLFDLYMRGIEKKPPMDEWEGLKKRMRKMRSDSALWSTVDKFRVSSAAQKLQTYDRMWQKDMKAVEEGTSRRDKMRKEKMRREASALEHQQAKSAARKAAKTPGAGGDGAGMSDDRMKRLYNVYMQAKKRTGENTNLSYDGLKKQLAKQIPAIKKKHNCKNVDFKVVLKNGKAMLKAVPK